MTGCNYIFYTPEYQYEGMPHGEMCGDLMPFYKDGVYTFLYLYKYCIYAIETKDFVHYDHFRLVLQNGTPQEQDWHAATGSVCWDGEKYYFYYTGFCEGNRGKAGKYEQAILRAVSWDLQIWEKDRDYIFYPDEEHFAGRHWRDPHVFWNPVLGKYCMLVTACEKDGDKNRSGCTAVYVSEDIRSWKYYDTICSPRIDPTLECQDVFQMNGRWYLTYSSYEKQWETKYKMADSFKGPWVPPLWDEKFDGRDFYAAKTVSDGINRYLVGWQSIRKDCTNDGRYVWGGNVIVHQLVPRENGELGVKIPDTILQSFSKRISLEQIPKSGFWKCSSKTGTADLLTEGVSKDGFGWIQLGAMKNVCLIKARLQWTEGTHAVGIMFHVSGDKMNQWCQLRLELGHDRMVLERSGKTEKDQFFEETRPVHFKEDRTVQIFILTSNDIVAAYVDDVALCGRCYGFIPGNAGVFAEYGSVQVQQFEMYEGEEQNEIR